MSYPMSEKTCNCAHEALEKKRAANAAGDYDYKIPTEPFRCPEINQRIHFLCLKCHERISFDFDKLTKDEARDALNKLDTPGSCPVGFHVELSWHHWWQFDAVLKAAFPEIGGIK